MKHVLLLPLVALAASTAFAQTKPPVSGDAPPSFDQRKELHLKVLRTDQAILGDLIRCIEQAQAPEAAQQCGAKAAERRKTEVPPRPMPAVHKPGTFPPVGGAGGPGNPPASR